MADELLTRDEVAALLGRDPEYVRKFLKRRGVAEQRGYRRSDVEPLIGYESQQGRRTDLLQPAATDAEPRSYIPPTQLALDITDRLRAEHRDCPQFKFGGCQPETPTTAELEIPAAATSAMLSIDDDWDDDADLNNAVRVIAAPVVAAELRRIYAAHWSNNTCCGHLIAELRDRADELDPPARQED